MRQRRLPLTDGARAAGAADAADSRGPTGAAHGPGWVPELYGGHARHAK